MATANLLETILTYKENINRLTYQNSVLQCQKSLALYEQSDIRTLEAAKKGEVRSKYAEIWEEKHYEDIKDDPYADYTDLPDYIDEIDRIVAEAQRQIDELTNWETFLTNEITVNDASIQEMKAYLESYQGMLTSNIQEDFEFGLGG